MRHIASFASFIGLSRRANASTFQLSNLFTMANLPHWSHILASRSNYVNELATLLRKGCCNCSEVISLAFLATGVTRLQDEPDHSASLVPAKFSRVQTAEMHCFCGANVRFLFHAFFVVSTIERRIQMQVNPFGELLERFSFECRKTKTNVITSDQLQQT